MKKAKWLCTAAAVLALSAVVAGCGGDEKKEAAKTGGPSGEVMVYTSIYPDIIDNVCKPAMSKVFPDMKVDWFQGGTEKVMTKMAGEIKAKKIGADVLMVAEPSYYLSLKNLKDVITDKDEKGAWSSVRISNMIIAYNSDKLSAEEAPKSWKDLTDPKWQGKIAMPNPMLSGTAFVAVAALADKYGWEYLTACALKKATPLFRTNF